MAEYRALFLYLGGHNGLSIFNTVECYNPHDCTWSAVAPMYSRRCRAGVTTLAGKLFRCILYIVVYLAYVIVQWSKLLAPPYPLHIYIVCEPHPCDISVEQVISPQAWFLHTLYVNHTLLIVMKPDCSLLLLQLCLYPLKVHAPPLQCMYV